MQNAKARTKYLRIPPRKARLAADLIRGMKVEDASLQLAHSELKGGRLLKKTLDSAVANAETQLNVPRQNLRVREVRVDAGPVIKRAKSKSRGGRVPVMKRTSHFTVVVEAEEK
jgi:large subunit ribosomal protein L22